MSAAHTPVGYDTAYPGSMVARNDGYYLRRDDHKSLAASLVELIVSRDREIEDLREGLEAYKRLLKDAPALLDALKDVKPHFRDKQGFSPEQMDAYDAVCAVVKKAQGGVL